ncbi:phosphatase [Psychromonas marina]|uniref:Phosphatase n=1 Tax=Psychromonas marina TaxID=88364 RepID=A0ABQ6DV27_9GAMM|nr:metallophosphoesterase [Psychromonas marina]GLS88971.1 phosphatase [Psychromonas marina]
MKIGYYSDLHLEFQGLEIKNDEADVIVLAGDIHLGDQGVKWAADTFKQPVVAVAGNHEAYTRQNVNLDQILYSMRLAAKGTNVHVLNNESIVIDGVNFIGSTLWSDFNLYGRPKLSMQLALGMINDYSLIKLPTEQMINRLFTPNDALTLFQEAMQFIQSAIEPEKENIIITHYGVDERCSHPQFHGDDLSAAFNSNLSEFITNNRESISAWIYGHTHHNLDFEIAGIPIITNQRGYAPYDEVPEFDECKLLSV